MADIDARLGEIAAKQHSLITLRDVLAAGGTKAHAKTRLKSGRWDWFAEGVYRVAGVRWTYEALVLAHVFAAGPGAVASHLCAARLHGLGFVTAAPEISVPRGRHHRPQGVRVHTSTDLDRCQVVLRNGIPVTDAARTLLDLGRYIRPQFLARAVESARRQELVTWHDLIGCLAAHARKGRHGVKRLRSVVSDGVANDDVTETDSELMALCLLREYGFAEPALQHRVYDADGELAAEMDIAYVNERVNFEIDGDVHLTPEVKKKDDARDHWLRQRSWTVRRIWWEIPVRQPEQFIRIVRDTLGTTRS